MTFRLKEARIITKSFGLYIPITPENAKSVEDSRIIAQLTKGNLFYKEPSVNYSFLIQLSYTYFKTLGPLVVTIFFIVLTCHP